MILRVLKYTAFALFYYILYYICQYSAAFLLPTLDAVLITVIGSTVFAAAVFGILCLSGKNPASEVGLTKLPWRDMLVLIFLGVAFNIFCVVAMSFIPFPESWTAEYADAASNLTDVGLIPSAVLTLVIAPIVEEMLFRGLIYGNLKRGIQKYASMVISAALFGAAHGTAIWIIYAAFFGFVLAWIYEKCRSLTASIVFHFGFNFVGFITPELGLPGSFYIVMFIPSLIFIIYTILSIQRTSK